MELSRGPSTASQYPTDPTVTAYAEAFATTHPPRPTEPPPAATPAPALVSVPTAAPTADSGQTSLSGAATAARATNVTAPPATATPPAAAATEPPVAPTEAPASTAEVSAAAATVEDVQPAAAETAQAEGGSDSESAPAATTAPASSHGVPVPLSGPISIDDPVAEQDVLNAYSAYWQAQADAFYDLDPSGLDAVADGQALEGLRQSISEDRAMGRALDTNVKLSPLVVLVQGDDAEIVDAYKNSSLWIDPTTKEPLPGQVAPASPDAAPTVSKLYRLHRVEGVWKVTEGTQYTCAGSSVPECSGVSG